MVHAMQRGGRPASASLTVCAVAALTAFTAPAASAQSLPAQRIVIDADTGRPRMPEPDELNVARAAQSARMTERAGEANAMKSALKSHPALQLMTARPLNAQLGARGARLDASRLSFTVVRRQADGSVATQCVAGEDNANKALHGALAGGSHDH